MAMTPIVVFCAIGVGVGLTGCLSGLRSRPGAGASGLTTATNLIRANPGRWPNGFASGRDSRIWVVKLGIALASGLLVGIFTRWPAAALLAAVATFTLPRALRSTSSRDGTRRTEAVAVWTELLRDTLGASAGLAQAIVATSGVAPLELRIPAAHLADRIMSGVSMDEALRLFAVELDDPSADEVVCALRLATTSRAQRLVDLLSALADSTREEVTMRLRVEASRASARSGVRIVISVSIGFVALLTVAARSYLAPFGSVTGQLVLMLVGVCYASGLLLMVRLVRPTGWRRPAREVLRG